MVPNFMGARALRKDGKAWPPLGYSQIPILGWGALSVYRQTNDRELIEQALPWLVAFDEWYSTERDVDGDGLIEYGAYEAVANNTLLQTARFETFDFHLPLDDMKLTRHPRRETGGRVVRQRGGGRADLVPADERAGPRRDRERARARMTWPGATR